MILLHVFMELSNSTKSAQDIKICLPIIESQFIILSIKDLPNIVRFTETSVGL